MTLAMKRTPAMRPWMLIGAAALVVWLVAYVQLQLLFPVDLYPVERAWRRLATHAVGAALCLAMVPFLVRISRLGVMRQIAWAAGLSIVAWLVHWAFRIAAFHLVAPLWGPLTPQVLVGALKGSGWMFPLWGAACLGVLNALHQASPKPEASPPANAHLWVQEGDRRVRVALEEVSVFEAECDYVRLHMPGRRRLVRARLHDLEARLPKDRYARVHRSYIVRLDAVTAIAKHGSSWRVETKDGAQALVSRKLGSAIRARITV